jgi:hypothetical protein
MCKKDAKVNSKNKTKGESNTKDRSIFTDPPATMCSINITNITMKGQAQFFAEFTCPYSI